MLFYFASITEDELFFVLSNGLQGKNYDASITEKNKKAMSGRGQEMKCGEKQTWETMG